MLQIISFQKPRLRVASHLSVIGRFVNRLSEVSVSFDGFASVFDKLKAALAREDADYKKATGSDITQTIQDADIRRDRAYGVISTIARSMAQGYGSEAQTKAATALARILNTYKVETTAQYDQESGMLEQLMQEIDKANIDLACIGLDKVYAELKAAQTEIDKLLDDRDKERAGQTTGDLKADRVATDAAYDEVVLYLNALLVLHPTEAVKTFVSEWNATVNRVRQQILKTSAADGGSEVDVDADTDADTDLGDNDEQQTPTPIQPAQGGGSDDVYDA